jgi:prolyl 4-hydroxylase
MSEQPITEALRAWILDQLSNGHEERALIEAMRQSGWDEAVAHAALSAPRRQTQVAALGGDAVPDLLESQVAEVWAHDRKVKVLAQMHSPRLVVLGEFLSPQECEALMALAQPRLARSETVINETGGSEVNEARTSQGMFFERQENELCARIEARISALLQWPLGNGEGIQVLRYLPGAQYRPHYDFFDPAQAGAANILRRGGQRVATVLMYLNTPASGGATTFPQAGLQVQAVAGHAVFFSYPEPHAGSMSLHAGMPVASGEKWVATKWLRAQRFD